MLLRLRGIERCWLTAAPHGRPVPHRARPSLSGSIGSMATNSAVEPVTRLELDGYDWYDRHAEILQYQAAVDPQIVLIGDSITHFFGALSPQPMPSPANAPKAFGSAFAGGRRVLNLGFGWDRTQNVLWRLDHGELDGLKPSMVVVNIGTVAICITLEHN